MCFLDEKILTSLKLFTHLEALELDGNVWTPTGLLTTDIPQTLQGSFKISNFVNTNIGLTRPLLRTKNRKNRVPYHHPRLQPVLDIRPAQSIICGMQGSPQDTNSHCGRLDFTLWGSVSVLSPLLSQDADKIFSRTFGLRSLAMREACRDPCTSQLSRLLVNHPNSPDRLISPVQEVDGLHHPSKTQD